MPETESASNNNAKRYRLKNKWNACSVIVWLLCALRAIIRSHFPGRVVRRLPGEGQCNYLQKQQATELNYEGISNRPMPVVS